MNNETGYEFLEDVAIADVAFVARAPDLAGVFEQAARATMETMLDRPAAIRFERMRRVELVENDPEMLLFDFLQELIYFKDAERLLLMPDGLDVASDDGGFRLTATLAGEAIDPSRHRLDADVKAVTMHRFRLEKTPGGWEAEIVLDI